MRRVATCGVVLVDTLQFGPQDHRLQFIQPAVVAYYIMVITHIGAVITELLDFGCDLITIGCNQAAITETTQILTGKKTETGGMTETAGLLIIHGRTKR